MMPDPRVGFIAHLKAATAITALVPTADIGGTPPGGTGAPKYAIAVQEMPGLGARVYVPQMQIRMLVRCYGPTDFEANKVARTVHYELEGNRQMNGFTAGGCRFLDVHLAASPSHDLNDAGWPLSLLVYDCWISEVAVV
jgi:hypothetical protein